VQKTISEGVVDLINFRGIVWNEEDQGMTFEEVEIPADVIDEAREFRGKLLEAVAEFDDTLLEKYFEDENSLTEREILDALRQATIGGKVIPMMCGSAFKNKGVQGHGYGNFTIPSRYGCDCRNKP
jgi:elongation factor G